MDDWRGEQQTSGRDFSGRGVYAAESDVPAGKTGIYAVVYVLRVEKYQGGVDRIFHGDYAAAGERFFSAQSVAQHAGYFERVSAKGRTSGVHRAAGVGGYTGSELWNL